MESVNYTDKTAREESAAAAKKITPTDKAAHLAKFLASQAELKAAKGIPAPVSLYDSNTPQALVGFRAPIGKLDGRQ